MPNLRDSLFEEKAEEVQKSLEAWAELTHILNPGERIVFSMHIEGVPTVVRETSSDYSDMKVYEFFSEKRSRDSGMSYPRHLINILLNDGVDRSFTMKDFLEKYPDIHNLMILPSFGRKTGLVLLRMLLAARLPIEDKYDHFLTDFRYTPRT